MVIRRIFPDRICNRWALPIDAGNVELFTDWSHVPQQCHRFCNSEQVQMQQQFLLIVTGVLPASMLSAGVAVCMVLMMVAVGVRIKCQGPCQQGGDCFIGAAL